MPRRQPKQTWRVAVRADLGADLELEQATAIAERVERAVLDALVGEGVIERLVLKSPGSRQPAAVLVGKPPRERRGKAPGKNPGRRGAPGARRRGKAGRRVV